MKTSIYPFPSSREQSTLKGFVKAAAMAALFGPAPNKPSLPVVKPCAKASIRKKWTVNESVS